MHEGHYSEEDSEDHKVCAGCFKRKQTGAADVYNAKRRLEQIYNMQASFVHKYEDRDEESRPKTFDTRERLKTFFLDCLERYDAEFKDQLPEYADPEDFKNRKRKRC